VKQQLKLLSAYPVYNEPGSHYRLHAHPFHELVLIHKGQYRARYGNDERIAVPGDILLYTAHTEHEEWVQSRTTVMTWCCWFEGDIFAPNEPVSRKDKNGKVQTLLAELSSLYTYLITGGKASREQECRVILQAMVDELKRLKTRGTAEIIEEAQAFIKSNLAQPFTVEELADHAGFSRCHFSELYRDATGQTPWNDIQRIRMEEAKRLIETTNLPLREIAPRVGIANEYHLSRLLKSLLGVGVRDLRHSSKDSSSGA